MDRILVVANKTLGGDHLREEVARRVATSPCIFHILVPATRPDEGFSWSEGEAKALARERLQQELARFDELGAEATGEVGSERPTEAITDCLTHREFDHIIVSTLPAGVSKWLRLDLPHRVERSFGLPVTHLVGAPEPAATA